MPSIINSDDGVVSGTSGLKTTGGNDGLLNIQTNGSTAMSINASQQVTFNNGANLPNTFGFKNRIINGAMVIDQRNNGAAQTITAGVNTYTVDRWFVVATGANVTGQRVAGSGNTQNNYRLTGAASVTGISFIQRIESNNCYDLAGQTVTLSVNLANSVLTTVNYQVAYAGATDNWSLATTTIASGSFTVSSTLTNFTAQISIPAAATTGLQVLFSVGAQTSGTWTIGQVQLEKGSTATSFDFRDYGSELIMCQRYYEKSGGSQTLAIAANTRMPAYFLVEKRAAPTVTYTFVAGTNTVSLDVSTTTGFRINNSGGGSTGAPCDFTWTAAIEL